MSTYMRIIGLLLLSCSLCMSCMQADKKKALIEDDFLVAEQHLSNQLKAVIRDVYGISMNITVKRVGNRVPSNGRKLWNR